MTKRKSKSAKTTVKASAAKGAVKRSSTAPATASPPLIVLGFDDQQKPRGARFVDAKPDLVTKAADLLGFKVYEASPEDVAEYAKKLPLGRLYANGRGFVPNIRQSLYSDLVVTLGKSRTQHLARTVTTIACQLPLACPGPGTRSRLAISSSPRSRSNTAGGRQSCSPGKATASPCSTATTRTCRSSCGIAVALR
jgi:hypothetical protein